MKNRIAIVFFALLFSSVSLIIGFSQTTVDVWMHEGQPHEREAMNAIIERFNENHEEIKAEITYIVESEYESKVATAAIAGNLPDLMDVDGPWVATWAWRGFLRPIGEFFEQETVDDFVPSIVEQGTWQDKLYALGQFESGLGLYYRKSILEEAGVEAPSKLENAWTWPEFMDVCEKVIETGEVERAVDIRWEWAAEWWTYGFSPIVWSNDGSLIGPKGLTAQGYMNSPETIRALEKFQEFIDKGYADPEATPDQFEQGKAAFAWVGHWMYSGYEDKFGDDLGITFLPGIKRPVTGSGSYTWGMTTQVDNMEAAAEVLKWIVKPESILMMTRGTDLEGNRVAAGNAAPPARESVYDEFSEYQELPLKIFTTQLQEGVAHARPVTPAYGAITRQFQSAINDIALGSEVEKTLNQAARAVDREVKANNYYGLTPPEED